MIDRFGELGELCRWRLSLAMAGSALLGGVLFSWLSFSLALLLFTGVFFLAAGCSTLNQVLERDMDAQLERTRKRSIPSGRVSWIGAVTIGLFQTGSGFYLLGILGSQTVFLLGGFAVLWYTGVYSPLKRVSAWAAVPGAVLGMIPPAMGWVAAGGSVLDIRLLALTAWFFLWQLPHFWLILLAREDEYRTFPFPNLYKTLGRAGLARLTAYGVWAMMPATIGLALAGTVPPGAGFLLLLSSVLLKAWRMTDLFEESEFLSRNGVRGEG